VLQKRNIGIYFSKPPQNQRTGSDSLEGRGSSMACEQPLDAYRNAITDLRSLVARLEEYANTVGASVAERPMALLSGEVNSWRRYAAEAGQAAVRQQQVLESFLEAALNHEGTAES
jgi:hypothetical protein